MLQFLYHFMLTNLSFMFKLSKKLLQLLFLDLGTFSLSAQRANCSLVVSKQALISLFYVKKSIAGEELGGGTLIFELSKQCLITLLT